MTDNNKQSEKIFEAINEGNGKIGIKIYSKSIPALLCALKLTELQIENKIIGTIAPPEPVIKAVEVPKSLRGIIRGNN